MYKFLVLQRKKLLYHLHAKKFMRSNERNQLARELDCLDFYLWSKFGSIPIVRSKLAQKKTIEHLGVKFLNHKEPYKCFTNGTVKKISSGDSSFDTLSETDIRFPITCSTVYGNYCFTICRRTEAKYLSLLLRIYQRME